MWNFLRPDSKFMLYANKFCDLIALNLMILIFCIPVFTVGTSITAMHYVLLKILRDELSGGVIRTFWTAFKSNFKQATAIWLVVLAAGLFLAYDASLAYVSTSLLAKVFMGVIILVALVYAMWVSWVFPVQCKFDNPVKVNMKNAALMMVIHMFPTTLLITVLNVVPLLVLWFYTSVFFWMLPLVAFLLFALIAYNNSKQLRKAFADYIPEESFPNDRFCE